MVDSDRSEVDLSDETIKIEKNQSKVKMKKTAENYRICYVSEKRIVSQLSTISIPNFNSTN